MKVTRLLLLSVLLVSAYQAPCLAQGNLVLWNKLGSQQEVENSEVGEDGTFVGGGDFMAGVFGNAFVAQWDEDSQITFPKVIIPVTEGCIEFWGKLIDPPTGSFSTEARPYFVVIQDTVTPVSRYSLCLTGDDGAGQGGISASAGNLYVAGSGGNGAWTYSQIFGAGQETNWHHYALVWKHDGIPGVSGGTRKVAVYLNGQLNSTRWNDYRTLGFPGFLGDPLLRLIATQNTQGAAAIDNLKIWDYAKTDFSDRFEEGPQDAPLLWYDFVAHSGGAVADASGNGNTGTAYNAVWTTNGFSGGAYYFDGDGDYVETANRAPFDFERTDPFTLAAWVKLETKTSGDRNHFLVTKMGRTNSTVQGYAIVANGETSGALWMELMHNHTEYTRVVGSTNIIDGEWHHVVGVSHGGAGDASALRLYVDGQEESTTVLRDSLGAGSILTDFALRTGNRSDLPLPVETKGFIDEVKVYGKALSAQEVADLYASYTNGGGIVGTYEISYMYNNMDGGGSSGPHNPEGPMMYNGVSSSPVHVPLSPGRYRVTIIPGRETGNVAVGSTVSTYWGLVTNNNPSAVFPETGYDGGNRNPDPFPTNWTYALAVWKGTSTAAASGTLHTIWGLTSNKVFTIETGESIWLYWYDWLITDNLGGVTVSVSESQDNGVDHLVLWNKLGSEHEVENSEVGEDGTFLGGSFTEGMFGTALIVQHDEILHPATFPTEVVPVTEGCIEFWGRLVNPDMGPLGPDGHPHWVSIADASGGGARYNVMVTGNDGTGNSGLCGFAGDVSQCASGGSTHTAVLGSGQETNWHHYAVVWKAGGIPGVSDGTKKVAVFLDGELSSTSWINDFRPNGFPGFDGSPALRLLVNNGTTQGATIIDNLKIWDYAKTDFSDRFAEGSTNGTVRLTVQGSPVEPGHPQPYDYGQHLIPTGSLVNCHVLSPAGGGAGTQYICAGWSGAGDVPASGTGTGVTFTASQESTLTWQWDTEYYLDVETDGNGTVDVGDGWYGKGTPVTLTATEIAPDEFRHWSGDVPPGMETNNPLTVIMDQARTIAAVFREDNGSLAHLVLWNKLGSQHEVENSEIGEDGTFVGGGGFMPGVFGSAFVAQYNEDSQVTFPKDVIPVTEGCIEFWGKLIDPPTGSFSTEARPYFVVIQDTVTPVSRYSLCLTGNDGAGQGGISASAGNIYVAGSGGNGSWTYSQILGAGQETNWHHYAMVWKHDGIPGVSGGTRKVAVYLDGQLNSVKWTDYRTIGFPGFLGDPLFRVIATKNTQGAAAIDNLKIWDYPKTDFSDRFAEGPGVGNPGQPANDFDGDGISDIGCYDADGHHGQPQGSWYLAMSTDGTRHRTFGYAGTAPVVGDFDADGKDDIACYDDVGTYGYAPGSWYFMMSTDGFLQTTFGYAGTIPVVGDFDGDGTDDFGCYDDEGLYALSPGSWYFVLSTDGFLYTTFGYAGTVPVVGDFDGDGTDDFGCYDDSGTYGLPPGSWYFVMSTDGAMHTTFGYEGAVPVVGDFDGDGLDDIGCYDDVGRYGQPPGSWFLMMSTDGFLHTSFGYEGAMPVVGDFDGDGIDDIGCYDDSGMYGLPPGSWFLMMSTDGALHTTFGYEGTAPVSYTAP